MNPLRLLGREPKGIIDIVKDISKYISFLSNKYKAIQVYISRFYFLTGGGGGGGGGGG